MQWWLFIIRVFFSWPRWDSLRDIPHGAVVLKVKFPLFAGLVVKAVVGFPVAHFDSSHLPIVRRKASARWRAVAFSK